MAAALYSTSTKEGVDINLVFALDKTATPEYPSAPFGVGELAWGTDGSEWVYGYSQVTITAGSAVLLSQTPGSWSVSMLGGSTVASASVPLGQLVGVVGGSQGSLFVPAISGTQSGNYFWVQRAGNCPNLRTVSAGAGKNSLCYSSATLTGALSTTAGGSGTTYQVTGVVFAVAAATVAGPNVATLNYPVVGINA